MKSCAASTGFCIVMVDAVLSASVVDIFEHDQNVSGSMYPLVFYNILA